MVRAGPLACGHASGRSSHSASRAAAHPAWIVGAVVAPYPAETKADYAPALLAW